MIRIQRAVGADRSCPEHAVAFTAPTERGTDRLVLRLWPNGVRYAGTGAHLSVSAVREGHRILPVSLPNPTTLVVARPMSAGELSDQFDVSKPTMSAHFAVLKEADLVHAKKAGKSVIYHLKLSVLEEAFSL